MGTPLADCLKLSGAGHMELIYLVCGLLGGREGESHVISRKSGNLQGCQVKERVGGGPGESEPKLGNARLIQNGLFQAANLWAPEAFCRRAVMSVHLSPHWGFLKL